MSGTTKKMCTKNAVNHKVAERSSKQGSFNKKYLIKNKNELEAFDIFMTTDFLMRYYQTNPRSTTGLIQDEADNAGQLEWFKMSDSQKDHWIEKAKKMMAEGQTLFSIRRAASALYPPPGHTGAQ